MSEEFFSRPIFRVRDVAASLDYYCEKLGFTVEWSHGKEAPIVAQVEREGITIILDSGSVMPKPAATSVLSMSMHQPEKLGELHRELERRGAKIVAPPFAVIWQKGTYELDVEDLDGNVLIFWGNAPE
jgi:predicted lactoylglutathione lyase